MLLRRVQDVIKTSQIKRQYKEIQILTTRNMANSNLNDYYFHKPKCKAAVRICSYINISPIRTQFYSVAIEETVDSNTFERVCEETLNSLADYFDDLVATDSKLEKADVMYGVGVLTIDLGIYGTYVINRQSPNKQIWLSSPTSGPKRFDYLVKEDKWIYKHDGQTLHNLLKKEFETIIGKELQLSKCVHNNS